MPLLLGQLVYTGFPGLGYRTLASAKVPTEIQQAFIQQVVYQHWDSLNPPKPGYKAAYLHQVTLEHTLFGWLYNDGLDNLVGSHVPYFVCYYLAELLQAFQLENIFTCLHRGPVALIDRQIPSTLETIAVPDLWSYPSARVGVAIPEGARERSHIALKQRRLLELFIPVDERRTATGLNEQNEKQQETDLIYTSDQVASNETDTVTLNGNTAAIESQINQHKEAVQSPQRVAGATRSQVSSRSEDVEQVKPPNKEVVVETKPLAFSETVTSRGKRRSQIAILSSLISFVVTLVVSGIITTSNWNKPCPVNSEKRVWGSCYRDLQARPLTIGIAIGSPDEDYSVLATHLRDQLGSQVEINKDTPYKELSNRIARKDWDIAFTRSPIFSIAAEDNRYIGVARMFPDQPPYYRSALYVRSDSPIQSIADIKSTTTIALGNPESAPTFQMPIYTLYGKSLRVGTGYRPREVVEVVKAGKVDVGAGRYAAVKDDPALRIIYVSKAIPGAGVYLSPLLSSSDQKRIKEALLNAPPEIQAKASYGSGQIPKYDELRKIISRTEKILGCPGFNINSFDLRKTVNLFCKEQNRDPNAIEGQVREYRVPAQGTIEFKVVTQKNQVYLVLVSKQILNQIPINPLNTVDKSVQLNDVNPRLLADRTWEVKITQPNQLSLL